jgi:hypothetical protein
MADQNYQMHVEFDWLTSIQFNNQVLNKIEEEALFLLLFSCLVTIVDIFMQYAKKNNLFLAY